MTPRELLARARLMLEQRDAMESVDLTTAKAKLLEYVDRNAAGPEPEPISREEADRLLAKLPPGPKRELLGRCLRIEWVKPGGEVAHSESLAEHWRRRDNP